MNLPKEIVIEKVPSLTCKKCGGFRVMMTDDGPECQICDVKPRQRVDLTEELENVLYQIECEETGKNEAF